jgi:hypothetical protein
VHSAHETLNKAGFISEQCLINDDPVDQEIGEIEGQSLAPIRFRDNI